MNTPLQDQAMVMLAESGPRTDIRAIELELMSRGHSLAAVRKAMSDANARRVLSERCYRTRTHPAPMRRYAGARDG